jgi:hypothetical protein
LKIEAAQRALESENKVRQSKAEAEQKIAEVYGTVQKWNAGRAIPLIDMNLKVENSE